MASNCGGFTDWRLRVRLTVGFGIVLAGVFARLNLDPAGSGLPYQVFYPSLLCCIVICATVPGLIGAALGAQTAACLFAASLGAPAFVPRMAAATGAFVAASLVMSLGVRRLLRRGDRLQTLASSQRFVVESDLIGIVKLRGRRVAWANAGLERMLGWERGELEGLSTRVAYPDDASYEAAGRAVEAARLSGSYFRTELRLVRKDGQSIWVDLHGAWQSPDIDESLWVLADITARKANEEALRKSQSFLARTGAVAGVGGWQYQLGAAGPDWSDETCRLIGVEPGHRPTLDEALRYYAPAARPLIKRAVKQSIKTGEPFDIELPMISATGRHFWGRAVGEAEFENGIPVRVVGALQDVTKRREIERDLVKTHELTRVTLESIGDGVITTDTNWNVLWLNPVAERLTGWDRQAARGRSLDAIFAVTDAESGPIKPGAALRSDAILISRDGTEYGIEASASPILDEAGDRRGTVLVIRDVTEQRRLNKAIRERERQYAEALARLDVLFRNSADSMMVARKGADGRFVYEAVNPVWERQAATPADRAIGMTPHDCLSPDLAAVIAEGWAACVRQRGPVSFSFRTDADGGRECESLAAPVIDEDGEINRLIAVARDVTERNQFEAGIRQMQRMEAVGQLTAGVAHDFNNLLQAIIGAIEILCDDPTLNAAALEAAAMADSAAQRGATLVHRLLAFSRKQSLDPAVLRPETVFSELGSLLDSTLGRQIRVRTRVEPGTWPVRADGAQLENCLFNLALNARDAMPDGGLLELRAENVRPDAALADSLPPGDYVRFTVNDNGTGMSQETLNRALEPFFTTKPIGKGTGLGLSMVLGFARQSGGDIRIASALGAGTAVSICLPRFQEIPVEITNDIPAAGSGTPPEPHVLIADDQAGVCRMLSLAVSKAGLVPVSRESGEAALAYLRAGGRCDLLVSDQSMAGMTGSALIGHAIRLRPSLPTMLITGDDMVRGLDGLPGRIAVLRKPFRQAVFLEQVKALLVV